MEKKFIPIIGTISAGKTTFIQGLLGTSLLERGLSTTTKFVCLIKNSEETKFYHVLPKREQKNLMFIKDGLEIQGEKNIKEKIEELNEKITAKDKDIFYMLEIPIKNIENVQLLEECYFMDIPGLNEYGSFYIDLIFSLLTLDDIKFEIIFFDSTNIDSDNIYDVIKKLEEKKCLLKQGNLFILNKIDQAAKNGDEEIINNFQQNFYKNFEDDKNDNIIEININKNKFIPFNSLLYLAETKKDEDFLSLLIVEFYNYLGYNNNQNDLSFYDYLKENIEYIINSSKEENKNINLDVKSIKEDELETIEKSIEEINDIKKTLESRCLIEINLKNKSVKNNMIKLFLLHKIKVNIPLKIKYREKLNQIFKEMDNNYNTLSTSSMNKNKQNNSAPIEKSDSNQVDIIDISMLNDLDKFLNDTFKKIDPYNELEGFTNSLQSLRDYLLGRRIRIAFIGNINVGKSTVLNCIIGEDILPIDIKECTYRGMIIRHVEENEFKLYKTKLIEKGIGVNKYYYFEIDKEPYCEGVHNIKSYLIKKNNDKIIENKDAYIVITGKLKIFDFIKMRKNLISKIEFIDLPGQDRKNNDFNKNEYYEKILKFSNCCIYVTEPKHIDDNNNVTMMIKQYHMDKQKVFLNLRNTFIKSCIFLINKSDYINDDKTRRKLEDIMLGKISLVENNVKRNDVNISFFSGKSFFEYIQVEKNICYLLDNNPGLLFLQLHREYNNSKSIIFNWQNFKKFIFNKLNQIEENFYLNEEEEEDEDEDEEEPLKLFSENIKYGINQIEKDKEYKIFYKENYDDIIKKLYYLRNKFKRKNFLDTEYSHRFFNDLKKAIENSEKIYKENLNYNIHKFFEDIDILFRKELIQEIKEKKEEKEKELLSLNFIKKTIEDNFSKAKNNIVHIFNLEKEKIMNLIDKEIFNASKKLKESNDDIEKASQILLQKINNIIEEMKNQQKKEMEKLMKKIEKEIENKFKQNEVNIPISNIDSNKGLTSKMIISLIGSTISGVLIRIGLVFVGETVLAGATTIATALTGPLGIAIGTVVGIGISLTTFLYHIFKKSKRYQNGLKDFKDQLETDFENSIKIFSEDFKTFEEEFSKAFGNKIIAFKKDIANIKKEQWEKLKLEYAEQKSKIMKKMNIFG